MTHRLSGDVVKIDTGEDPGGAGGAMPPPGSPSGLGHVMSRWTTGSRTASLVPTTISSTTAARDGTSSSISPGGSCPSITPMGAWVLINGIWYKAFQGLAPARRASPGAADCTTSSAMVTRLLCAVSTAANHVSKRTSGLPGTGSPRRPKRLRRSPPIAGSANFHSTRADASLADRDRQRSSFKPFRVGQCHQR